MKINFKKVEDVVLPLIGIIIVLIVWYGISHIVGPSRLPYLSQIYGKFRFFFSMGKIAEKTIFEHIYYSLRRILWGWGLASACGIIFGLLAALSTGVDLSAGTIYRFFRCIPPIAWIPLAILWFGIGEASKIFIVFWGALSPVFINTYVGVKMVPSELIDVGRMFKATRFQLFTRIVLPAALPYIFTGIKVALGGSWMCLVAAEMVAALEGLGYLVIASTQIYDLSLCITSMITMGVIALLMTLVLDAIEKKVCPWVVRYR